jgi:hypothetical protein
VSGRMKNALTAVFYLALVFLVFHVGWTGLETLRKYAEGTFDYRLYHFSYLAYHFLFGIMVALPYWERERKRSGAWTLNKPLFLIVFLPVLLIILHELLMMVGLRLLPLEPFSLLYGKLAMLLPVLCGSSLVMSFEKK